MNFQGEKKHMVDILFVLTLFFVFALSALTLIILGANIYRTTVDHMDESFTTRTSYAYITQKIRQNDESDALAIGKLGNENALIMTSEVNNTIYKTYIYSHDGYLCELLARADMDMDPSAGTRIIEVDDFSIDRISPNLFDVNITTPDNDELSFVLSTHSSNEGEQIIEE